MGKKGFGFIKPKEGFNFDEKDFPADKKEGNIYFGKEDLKVSYDDRGPSVKRGAEVEFVIFKNEVDGKPLATEPPRSPSPAVPPSTTMTRSPSSPSRNARPPPRRPRRSARPMRWPPLSGRSARR